MDKLIESSNFLWLIIAGFATWRVACWKLNNHLSEHNREIVTAWVWIFLAAAVNHGWFAFSRHLSPEGERWHPAMFEWRWLLILLTSLAFSWGMLAFIRLIDGHGYKKQSLIFALSFIAAFGIGYW